MREFIRREWLTLILWTLTGALLWYALSVDRSELIGAYGLIATGICWEFIHRVFGSNKRDRQR